MPMCLQILHGRQMCKTSSAHWPRPWHRLHTRQDDGARHILHNRFLMLFTFIPSRAAIFSKN
jgi:hypothetical protein